MKYHIHFKIATALEFKPAMMKSFFPNNTIEATKKDLQERFDKGELLVGPSDCEGFDPITGCPGHEVTEEET